MAARENLPRSIGNGISTSLVSSITNSALSLQVNDPSGINTSGGYIVVDFNVAGKEEVMYVESRSSNTLNIATDGRGLGGTSAVSHDAGATVQDVLIDEMINNIRTSFVAEHDQAGAHTAINAALSLSGNTINSSNKAVDASGSNTASGTAVSSTNKLIDRALYHAIEGQMMNGKLSVTVASNNITVAVKTLAGSDPSVASPVSVLINGTIRTITAALSVTKNAGTNWCNSGSAELATQEVDYFAYLGYNATDGVVIGFSRIPYARAYSQFSTTTTDEKYCAISTITNAASTDPYVVVGRFAATLSAGAGYTWSVPTFTAINLISAPIFETRKLSFTPQWSAAGSMTYTSVTSANNFYKVIMGNCEISLGAIGTTGGVANQTLNATAPFLSSDAGNSQVAAAYNSLSGYLGGLQASNGTRTCFFYLASGANYSLGAGRQVSGKINYTIV